MDSHDGRIYAILQQLEERIAELVLSAPLQDGNLFDLAWSIQARADIEQIMRETFLSEGDSIVREYDRIVASMDEMLSTYGAFTGVQQETIDQLKRVAFSGFQDIASTYVDDLANELYQNTLTGRPINDSIKTMRQRINGVYIASDQAEVERLVELANGGDEEAVKELHRKYSADRTGRNMRKYATQMVHDTTMQFDASINIAAGKEIGATKWKYYGSVIRDSREFCQEHAGQIMTEEYIRDTWANRDWQGKAEGDPFIVRGGYNCRHHFRPVIED